MQQGENLEKNLLINTVEITGVGGCASGHMKMDDLESWNPRVFEIHLMNPINSRIPRLLTLNFKLLFIVP
jgi:hypothetical protein